MKTLLIPLDGSELGEGALSYALEHFPREQFAILLLHCMDLNSLYASSTLLPTYLPEMEAAERKRHQTYLDGHLSALAERGYQARSHLSYGDPVAQILATAEAEGVDQILLSTHGRSGLSRIFLGSVAEGVIRRALVPVLVVPSTARLQPSDPIVPGVVLP